MEFALLHGAWYPEWRVEHLRYMDAENSSREELMTKFVEQIGELAEAVAEDVELGFHLCYGNIHSFWRRLPYVDERVRRLCTCTLEWNLLYTSLDQRLRWRGCTRRPRTHHTRQKENWFSSRRRRPSRNPIFQRSYSTLCLLL